jgi:FkbM family methyltransferase
MSILSRLQSLISGRSSLILSLAPLNIRMQYSEPRAEESICALLKNHPQTIVIDVGANIGQFAMKLRKLGYAGRIISFEPTSRAHEQLTKNAAHDDKWTIAPRCAVGAKPGKTKINISANSVSSSLLAMLDLHRQSDPNAHYVDSEEVQVVTLDKCAFIPKDVAVYMKIDTQGFELEVLKGADSLLDRAQGVLTEVSFKPLYEEAPNYLTICQYLAARGFGVWAIKRGFADRKTGQQFQADMLFSRN